MNSTYKYMTTFILRISGPAMDFVNSIRADGANRTLLGVHVRRTDYEDW